MPLITKLTGRTVFNSRGNTTVEVDIITDNNHLGRACAPSGASVGKHEAQSFPDDDPSRAIKVFQSNAERFIGAEASDPKAIFEIIKSIDNTPYYSKLGGSVAYALSIAAVDSASKALGVPLVNVLRKEKSFKNPFPLGNILGGGAHAGPGTPDIQEILVCPLGASDVLQALDMNFKVHAELRRVLERADKSFTYGSADEQIEYVNSLIQKYNLTYVEDPVHEEDFLGMAEITKKNRKCLVTGDDMLVTNKKRVMEASKYDACSGAILKVNQAGTLYDALLFAKECDRKGLKLVTSHRSGEAVDSHISHIAIATQSKMLKSGILGGERVAKINELIRLAEYDLIDGMTDLSF